jgi:hypothetical protein
MVVDKIYRTPIATTSTIVLFVNETFFCHYLFNKDGKGHVELLKGEKKINVVKIRSFVLPWHTYSHYFVEASF